MVLKVTHLGFQLSPSKPCDSFSKLPFISKERKISSSRSFSSGVMAFGKSRFLEAAAAAGASVAVSTGVGVEVVGAAEVAGAEGEAAAVVVEEEEAAGAGEPKKSSSAVVTPLT